MFEKRLVFDDDDDDGGGGGGDDVDYDDDDGGGGGGDDVDYDGVETFCPPKFVLATRVVPHSINGRGGGLGKLLGFLGNV